MTTTREEGGDGDGGDGAADFEEEHQFWLPPLLNGEYDVIIPGKLISFLVYSIQNARKEDVYK
jgi:hypothetical protein